MAIAFNPLMFIRGYDFFKFIILNVLLIVDTKMTPL